MQDVDDGVDNDAAVQMELSDSDEEKTIYWGEILIY
jgi:hypothetical protein